MQSTSLFRADVPKYLANTYLFLSIYLSTYVCDEKYWKLAEKTGRTGLIQWLQHIYLIQCRLTRHRTSSRCTSFQASWKFHRVSWGALNGPRDAQTSESNLSLPDNARLSRVRDEPLAVFLICNTLQVWSLLLGIQERLFPPACATYMHSDSLILFLVFAKSQ